MMLDVNFLLTFISVFFFPLVFVSVRRQWVREEDLAKELKQNAKELRKLIRFFEEQKFLVRYHRKETAKRAKMYSFAVAATTDGRAEDNVKFHTHSYCCLDYAQIYDTVRYKLHRMKKQFKDELEDKNTVQEYCCPNCKVEMKPLMDQINIVKDLPFPGFEPFPAWEARAAKAARENGVLDPNDPSRSQGGYGSTPMPFLGETKVEVNLGEEKQDVKSKGGDSSLKILPPWMIKQGMKLTEEQRGEMRQGAEVDGEAAKLSDDKKTVLGNGDGDKDVKDEYVKAYYAALLKQQEELAENLNQQESAGESTTDIQLATTSPDRQVGMKSKREEEEEEEEDVEWEEEAPVAANGNDKVDLNVEAEDEEEEDDIDWEEG
ncbi:PREDICTED: uncharacterized protein LOC104727886 [Camelina sativa]|uniref:Uncharacterized protein LOC104727886 n=1 Tax=Camelina sativa TaxID=90675 RepID=A0ABM1QKT9_CAMSA|nr:PREDICTED: uncharacterized protein LOC104727886 [Camelina sativa]